MQILYINKMSNLKNGNKFEIAMYLIKQTI
jgi:hypothetical protein